MIKFNFIRRISLKTVFMGLVLLVSLILAVTVLFFTYEGNKYVNFKITERIMEEVFSATSGKLKTYFNTPYASITGLKFTIENHGFDLEKKPSVFFNHLKGILVASPTLDTVYFGGKDGTFFMAKRMSDLSISYMNVSRSSDSVITIWRHENLKYLEEYPSLVQSLDEGYDPRKRPWYIKAKKLNKTIWTEPYISPSDRYPNITVAVPTSDEKKFKGVVGIDASFKGINDFISSLEMSKIGSVFLIDSSEKFLAYVRVGGFKVNKFYKEVKNQNGNINIEMLEFADVNDKKLDKIYKYFKDKKDSGISSLYKNNTLASILNYYINFFVTDTENFKINSIVKKNNNSKIFFLNQKIDGEKNLTMIADFEIVNGISSKLGIILPQEAIIGYFEHAFQIVLIISTIVLLISIVFLTYVLNKGISSPIMFLSNKMLRMVKNFELKKGNDFISNLKEIRHMGESFESVRKAMVSFTKYLPREVVGELITKGEEAKIGGKNRVVTIFFSDIKDFIKISEDNPSDILLVKLEEYFSMANKIISSHKGILDKYIGDVVMAIWGAPHKINKPAAYACVAAVEIINKMKVMNKKFETEKFSKFIIRIGINTDNVLVGNIGSENRINYTCLGDGVNLASRLGKFNKFYKTQILVSNKTIQEAKDYVESRLIDRVVVKGKSQRILIHEVIAKKGDLYGDDKKFLEIYKKAIHFYFSENWNDAVKAFTHAITIRPKDFVTQLYLEKSQEYSLNPPEDGSQNDQLLQIDIEEKTI